LAEEAPALNSHEILFANAIVSIVIMGRHSPLLRVPDPPPRGEEAMSEPKEQRWYQFLLSNWSHRLNMPFKQRGP
jgi:hypothetical protein